MPKANDKDNKNSLPNRTSISGFSANRLPGSGQNRNSVLAETWASIASKTQPNVERNNTEARIVTTDRLVVNPHQPRQVFNPEADAELAEDIKIRGILEPIIVRPFGEDEKGVLYQIVAGERRFRAAKAAALKEVPVIIKDYDDRQARLASLVENLQRVDLHPEDEARYFNLLIEQFNLSYKEIAGLIHRSATYVSDRMKLLSSPKSSEMLSSTTENQLERGEMEDGEKNHLHTESERKLKKSQSSNPNSFVFRPVVRFRTFIERTRAQLPEISSQDKELLLQELKELRQQLEELEQAASQ